jgi:hypothetical protein
MPLLEMQLEFSRALGPQVPAPEGVASVEADERLDVYRGTVRSVLVKALSLNFPTVQRLVGAEFFGWAAALFAADHLPAAANLDVYGDGFADFLHALPSCAALPYLPEVARLDWAVSRALHADDAEPLEPAAFEAVVERTATSALIAHPAVSLLECRYPVDQIWSAVLGDEPGALERIEFEGGPCWLLIERQALRPQVSRLTRGEWHFAQALFGGQSIGRVLSCVEVESDAPQWLARHIVAGRIVGWRVTDIEENP